MKKYYKLNCLFLFLLSIRIENFLLKLINLLLKQKRFLNPASNYLSKGKAKNTRLICEICPKLTRKTHNDIIDIILVSLLQLWIYFRHFPGDSLAVFEQVNVGWVYWKYYPEDNVNVLSRFKVNNKNVNWHRPGVFMANFKHI